MSKTILVVCDDTAHEAVSPASLERLVPETGTRLMMANGGQVVELEAIEE